MVYYLSKKGDTATIRIVVGDISKMNCSLYGGDIINIDNILNNVNADENIQHFNISVGFYHDEEKISKYFKTLSDQFVCKDTNDEKDIQNKKEVKEDKHKHDNVKFKCPKCGGDDALVDKNGVVHPCESCIQIDTAKKLLEHLTDKCTTAIEDNTTVISALLNRFKGLKK